MYDTSNTQNFTTISYTATNYIDSGLYNKVKYKVVIFEKKKKKSGEVVDLIPIFEDWFTLRNGENLEFKIHKMALEINENLEDIKYEILSRILI